MRGEPRIVACIHIAADLNVLSEHAAVSEIISHVLHDAVYEMMIEAELLAGKRRHYLLDMAESEPHCFVEAHPITRDEESDLLVLITEAPADHMNRPDAEFIMPTDR